LEEHQAKKAVERRKWEEKIRSKRKQLKHQHAI